MRISGSLLVLLAVVAVFLWVFRVPDADIATLEAKYGQAPSQFITLPLGERVHLRDQGNPDGRVLILLHGTSASLHTWEPWVAQLGDDYRIITVDLPGHGLTGPIASCDYSVECSVRMVEDVREYLGLEHFVIGGNSLGGQIAWRYALAYARYVDGLILSDASGGPNINPAPMTPAFVLAGIPVLNHLLEIIMPRSLVEKGLQDATSVDGFVTADKVDRYWQLGRRPGNRKAM
ncbi:Hydrolase, alpha/beta fold family, partial [hydrothermal vent metagenome]